jgi:hypothetical protein
MNQLKDKHYYIIAKLIAFIFPFLLISGCNNNKEKTISTQKDLINATQIADTIIYDVLVLNPDPDDEWINDCIDNLNKNELVEFVFNAVYNEKAKAYHYFTNELFSIEDVKAIENEPDYSRDKIAKIQFVEEWLINEDDFKLYKQVQSIMLGYEVRNENGEIRGYKPTFRVYFNK